MTRINWDAVRRQRKVTDWSPSDKPRRRKYRSVRFKRTIKRKRARQKNKPVAKQQNTQPQRQAQHDPAPGSGSLKPVAPSTPPAAAPEVPPQSPAPPSPLPPQTGPAAFLARLATVPQQRIDSAVQNIADQAWIAAPVAESPETRLKAAKQEALRLIHRLSPTIRRDVENAFTSKQWAPLLSAQSAEQLIEKAVKK